MINASDIIDTGYTDRIDIVKTSVDMLNRASDLLAQIGVNLSDYVNTADFITATTAALTPTPPPENP